jgi:hypothetical protein
MSLNLKKLNKDFDKKMNEILDNMSFEYLKNLFNEKILRKKKIEEIKEEEPDEKEYIDFPIEVSQEVIDLKRKFEAALYQDEKKEDNTEIFNEEIQEKKHLELLEFFQNNVGEDRKLPKESEILNAMDMSDWELRNYKDQLVKEGHLEKINKRTFLLKTLKNTKNA